MKRNRIVGMIALTLTVFGVLSPGCAPAPGQGEPAGGEDVGTAHEAVGTTCQQVANYYGIVAWVTFGFAPTHIQTWWTQNNCTASSTSSSGALCRNAANLFAIDLANQSWGGAPLNVRTWWRSQGCISEPRCQGVSNLFGTRGDSNFTWGYAPGYVIDWYADARCTTVPSGTTSTCQRAMDTFGITSTATYGTAPDYVQSWWASHCAPGGNAGTSGW